MTATFFYMMRRYRLAIAFWGIGMAIVGIFVVLIYESIADKQRTIERLLTSMPLIVKAFAGDVSQFVTPAGWVHLKYFFVMPMSFGVFAVVTGSGLIANDEEQGRLDLLMAYPLSRTQVFIARCASLNVATCFILVIAWSGMSAALPFASLGISSGALGLAFITLLVVTTVFQALALLFSMLLPSRVVAAGSAGIILIVSFFLEVFLHVQPALLPAARCFPLRYYQGGMATNGIDWIALGVLVMVSVIAWWFAWRLFLKREIRVMGEGNFAWKRRQAEPAVRSNP